MNKIKSVCVFCGASDKVSKDFLDEAYKTGSMIAKNNYNLIYGAGDCGLMGAVADGALKKGGKVIGVFPKILEGLEAEHKHLSEIIIVDDMHTRKMEMFLRSDAFIILPGGFGTMDETFEVITWKQLYTHNKPIILYNYKNYWDFWKQMTDKFINLGFASPQTASLYKIVDKLEDIFSSLKNS